MSSLQPRDSHVTDPAEVHRLTGQNLATLKRLKLGPATAQELAAIALKYTSRISDLREAGYDIKHEAGIYRLLPSEGSRKGSQEPHNLNVAAEGSLF